jgi:anti-anti-sigma factor
LATACISIWADPVKCSETGLPADLTEKLGPEGVAGIARLRVASSQVSYIDSSGVAVLLLARQLCQQAGIGLHFDPPAEPLFRVLELARLAELLHLPPPLRPQNPAEAEGLPPANK